jgi:tetratricopeptide (TPR) repeat protein
MGMEDTRLAAARALLAVERTEAALREVNKVLAEQPEDADAWCLLAMCHRRAGDLPNALSAARRAVALAPDGEWAYRLLAEMERKSGRYHDAVATARRAVALAPLEWRAHLTLVHALLDRGGTGLAEAREPIARTLALAPDVPDGYVLAGRVHARLGEPDLARELWTRALELDPDSTAAQTLLARDDLAHGRVDEGVAGLRSALRNDPTNPAVPATVERIRLELLWRAARRSALACAVLVGGLLALSGTGLRLWLAPVGVLLAVGAQAVALRGYPDGLVAVLRDARRDRAGLRMGVVFLAAQLLTVPWAGLSPDPLRPGLFTAPVYALVGLVLVAPLAWLLGERRRPTVAALYRLARRR